MVGEVEKKVFNCIDNKKSFIIEAGAGSGKTWTLVQTLFYIINTKGIYYKKFNKTIACITYTNVAKEEIIDRIKANELVEVKTIHEFLWDIIKPFQKEMKAELVNLINEKIQKESNTIEKSKPTTQKYKNAVESIARHKETLEALNVLTAKIEYKEFSNRKKGVISHDDVLYISNAILKNYPVIYKVIEDTYPIIFIDEYQDTNRDIALTILEYLKENSTIVFGFFGDYNQQIYGGSIGKIDSVKYGLEVIPKEQNYRCSIEIIDILNKLRNDIVQSQEGEVKNGKCTCYYLNNSDTNTDEFVEKYFKNDIGVSSSDELKQLYLVTKTIAKKNNYFKLHELYDEENKIVENRRKKKKDQLLKNKDNRDCPFANFLFAIEEIIELFCEKRIQLLLKKTSFEILSLEDKVKLNNYLIELQDLSESKTIREIFEYVDRKNILVMPNNLKPYFKNTDLQDEFFNSLMNLEYIQFKNLYYTVKKSSPFSTNHGTKGAEYDNVICFIDDNDWRSSYSFNKYFDNTDFGTARYEKTKNLFYVICSRAKYNLAIVILSELSTVSIKKIKKLFGIENFKEIQC